MASTNGNDNGGRLPTHAAASSKPAAAADLHQKQRVRVRRCRCIICGGCVVATLLLLAILLLVLFLTVLCVQDLTTRLVSTHLVGLAPWLTFLALSLQLNVTLLLTVAVHNPNPASFAFPSGGHTDLTYRDAHVGEAEIDPGRVPSKGDGNITMALTLQADRFAGDIAQLIADVEAGSLLLEASTRIPGRVDIFGVFKHHVVAYSDCSFVFGVSELTVHSQQCSDHTKLWSVLIAGDEREGY